MGRKVERQCPGCGTSYLADEVRLSHGRQTTCSRACSYLIRGEQLQSREEQHCSCCGAAISRTPSQMKGKHGLQFCSLTCARQMRKRTVSKPYNRVCDYDHRAAGLKAWVTRRANAKPYPESARAKLRAHALHQMQSGSRVSKFEREVAATLRRLGFNLATQTAVRGQDGRFACVFDIVLPARKLVIECHGSYWHGGRFTWDTPGPAQAKNLVFEERKLEIARELGFELRLLWEHAFNLDPCGACLTAVA